MSYSHEKIIEHIKSEDAALFVPAAVSTTPIISSTSPPEYFDGFTRRRRSWATPRRNAWESWIN